MTLPGTVVEIMAPTTPVETIQLHSIPLMNAVIHPRAVALHRSRPEGSPRNVWHGRATGIELYGDRARVRVEGEVPIVAEVTPAALAELKLGEGGEVWLSFKATDVGVYPA